MQRECRRKRGGFRITRHDRVMDVHAVAFGSGSCHCGVLGSNSTPARKSGAHEDSDDTFVAEVE